MAEGTFEAVNALQRWRSWPRWRRAVAVSALVGAASVAWVVLVDSNPYAHNGGRLAPDDTIATTSDGP